METYQEERVQEILGTLEKFMVENKNATKTSDLPGGWAYETQELSDLLGGCWDEPFMEVTQARAERFLLWINKLSNKKKMIADELILSDDFATVLNHVADLTDSELLEIAESTTDDEWEV